MRGYRGALLMVVLMVFHCSLAIASEGYTGGHHASGISNDTVYLNDLEDHNWTYYSGIDEDIDGTQYKTKYYSTNTLARIYSPNPRNVKITYIGNGLFADNDTYNTGTPTGVQVSTTETENVYVYYETLDRHGTSVNMSSSDYFVYSVIPNPFSKRPSRFRYIDATTQSSDKTYYGCRKWYVESITGGTIIDADGNAVHSGGYLLGDTDINLIPDDVDGTGYSTNCISMEIVLKAYWEQADRVLVEGTDAISYSNLTKGHRELNFLVLNRTTNSTISNGNTPVTVMMVEPDGIASTGSSYDYRNTSNYISLIEQGTAPLKVEYAYMGITGTMAIGNNHDIFFGRGLRHFSNVSSLCINQIRGTLSDLDTLRYRLRVESGCYGNVGFFNKAYPGGTEVVVTRVDYFQGNTIWGNDYDRARKDHTLLTVRRSFSLGFSGSNNINNKNTDVIFKALIKSGNYIKLSSGITGGGTQSCYFADAGTRLRGHRYIEVQDGDFTSFASGWSGQPSTKPSITYRIKGGYWNGCIYGAASEDTSDGTSYFVISGGRIDGWIAGGCNGMYPFGGVTDGGSKMYIGGKAHIGDGNGNTKKINTSYGGNIYGAGSGNLDGNDVGKMTLGTNVVIADNAVVEGDVFGGGNSGYTLQKANVTIAGGTVWRGVYGGSNQNRTAGEYANVLMVGGLVKGGVYGGCNQSGVLKYDTNVTIKGGTVGQNGVKGIVCGGGLGENTVVTGDVNVVIGAKPAGTDSTANKDNIAGLIIYGEVYGGSALGYTNVTPTSITSGVTVNTTTPSDKSTSVIMYSGTVDGDVYGGALGSVSKPATIGSKAQTMKIYGGKVTGGVYGGSNINASMTAAVKPRQGVTIHDTWTPTASGDYAIGSVFGGGNGETAAASGQPGAHDTHADGTFVIVENGSVGNVFGGGNAATVRKGTVNINGGTIGSVFGGGNLADVVSSGADDGVTVVNINSCDATVGSVYGGCNAADIASDATTTIWGGTIGDAFAGGNGVVASGDAGVSADIGGDALLTIHGGTIGRAFAGSNNQGTITGSMDVVIDHQAKTASGDACPQYISEVYGGGNLAAGRAGRITIDCTADTIGDLYGGANQARVTTNIALNISKGKIKRVFGGNNTSGVIDSSIIVNINKDTECSNFYVGNVYGGGNLAPYTAPTDAPYTGNYPQVNVLAGTVTYDVFGGGLGTSAIVTGTPTVVIDGGTVSRDVYGGGSLASVTGKTLVTLTSGSVTGNVYGGGLGRNASGDAIAANVSDSTIVNINGGTAGNVFGCNNLNGAPTNGTAVTVTDGTISGNVYGGGNLAAASVSPSVTVSGGSINKVFGGGYGATAIVTGNPQVNLTGATVGDVFGGGDQASLEGNPTLSITGGQATNIFGGGNKAIVDGTPTVTVTGASTRITGNVFGGGNQGDVTGSPKVTVGGTTL